MNRFQCKMPRAGRWLQKNTVGALLTAMVILVGQPGWSQGQNVESDLERLMTRYEQKVLAAYQEKQTLENSPRAKAEYAAFDSVISAYTERVLEIYKTLNRIKGFTLENYRQIAARALIFRALAFVENAQDQPERAARACADYRQALLLTKASKIPIISQQLPYEVWIGDRLFTRLADLLDEKDAHFILLRCMRTPAPKENARK